MCRIFPAICPTGQGKAKRTILTRGQGIAAFYDLSTSEAGNKGSGLRQSHLRKGVARHFPTEWLRIKQNLTLTYDLIPDTWLLFSVIVQAFITTCRYP
jgi:hypothetical protein